MAARRLHFVWKFLFLFPVPLLWCVLVSLGFLEFFENRSVDWRFRYRGELEAPAKIVYVDIDSRSLDPQEIGGWPWSRSYFEVVARTLIERAGVSAVGIDIVLSDSGVSESVDREKLVAGNLQFARYLYQDPPVVLAAAFAAQEFRDARGVLTHRQLPRAVGETRALEEMEPPELPTFLVGQRSWTPAAVGLIDTRDGGTRAVPLHATSNVRRYYHLTVELLRRHWNLPPEAVQVERDRMDFVRPDGTIVAQVPLQERQFLEVNWFTRWQSVHNPRESFSVVYAYALNLQDEDPAARASAEAYFAQAEWQGAIVLIGPEDPLLQDLAPTPLDDAPVPRVGVHGNALKTILSGRYLRRLPEAGVWVVIFGLAGVVTVLALAGGPRALWMKVSSGMVAAAYAAAAFELFRTQHLVLPLMAPLGAAFTTSFAAIAWQVIEEQKAKGRIKAMFGTYLAPELVEQMISTGEDPHLGGHDREITAYFSDIEGFSSFAELLPSARLGELLNEYLTACTDIVQAERGTLDKYIGDALVAMFGAPISMPDHAYRACVAAHRVQLRLGELREAWQRDERGWPDIVTKMRVRIGLNTGFCMIGNMGSRVRFNYTMMGDNVNLAARMESGAKSWGVFTMVTEATREACEQHGPQQVLFRPLGRIVVVGRSRPVPVYELVGLKSELPAQALDCIEVFQQALERYFARDWRGARSLLERSAALELLQPGREPGVRTNPSRVYLRIVDRMAQQQPPEDWDGTYAMTEK